MSLNRGHKTLDPGAIRRRRPRRQLRRNAVPGVSRGPKENGATWEDAAPLRGLWSSQSIDQRLDRCVEGARHGDTELAQRVGDVVHYVPRFGTEIVRDVRHDNDDGKRGEALGAAIAVIWMAAIERPAHGAQRD